MIKKGDTVRFLNAVGGGVVVRVDETNKLIFVEDANGFEIPVLERECVMVGVVNEKTNFPLKDFKTNKVDISNEIQATIQTSNPQNEIPEQIIETPYGENLKVLLAFFPTDIKQLQTTSYECYLVNDSNYFLFYNLIIGENNNFRSIANAVIEPNTQELLADISKEDLNEWERLHAQIIPFKKDKNYTVQAAIDLKLNINVVKFYKLHSFTSSDYFDHPAFILDLTAEKGKEVEKQKLSEISSKEIEQAMLTKEFNPRPRIIKNNKTPEMLEIDLHINELLDSTVGLSNGDILQYQLDKFHNVIAEHKNSKGQKIVFIHGKGEGILRNEIEKQLKLKYKNYNFQDASFREYGFGATMVIIK